MAWFTSDACIFVFFNGLAVHDVDKAIFAEEFLQPHLWRNAINLAITQGIAGKY